jgi:ribosomal protein S18 acetylase RimI-like enzyme
MTRNTFIRSVSVAEPREALRHTLATHGQSDAEIEQQVSAFLDHVRALKTDIPGQWLAVDGNRVIGACTCAIAPGRTAVLILPSPRVMAVPDEVTARLVAAATLHAQRREIRLLQSLVAPGDRRLVETLRRLGWTQVADLQYMEASTDNAADARSPPAPAAGEWRTYDESTHGDFARLIEATYTSSMDCPALAGMREIDDIIAGHRAAALFRPGGWRMLCERDQPVGCILIGENPLQPAAELIYMGVHPLRRGRGLGSVLLRDGFDAARRDGLTQISLAVDMKNAPALRLYERFGFRPTMQRVAMVRQLDGASTVDAAR